MCRWSDRLPILVLCWTADAFVDKPARRPHPLLDRDSPYKKLRNGALKLKPQFSPPKKKARDKDVNDEDMITTDGNDSDNNNKNIKKRNKNNDNNNNNHHDNHNNNRYQQ